MTDLRACALRVLPVVLAAYVLSPDSRWPKPFRLVENNTPPPPDTNFDCSAIVRDFLSFLCCSGLHSNLQARYPLAVARGAQI